MIIEIPHTGVVILAGPPCAGKSTLARRLLDQSSAPTKEIHDVDKILDEMPRDGPELGVKVNITASGQALHFAADDSAADIAVETALADMIERCQFVVSDELRFTAGSIQSTITLIRTICDITRPIVILKVSPHRELHEEFYDQRESAKAEPLLKEEVMLVAEHFRRISKNSFADSKLNVVDYLITDPRRVEFKFI